MEIPENMNILEELDSKSASPSLHFKNSLKERVVSRYIEEPAEGRFFFNERTVNFLSIFIVILSVGIVAGAGIISFSNGNNVLNVDSVAAVPANQKSEILEGIIKNNPGALILQTDSIVSDNPTTVASVAESAQKVSVSSEESGYNFSYTKATNEFGKNNTCSTDAPIKEIYNFSGKNLTIYRLVNLDKDNRIIDSVQVRTQDDVSTSVYSRAGEQQVIFSSNNLEPIVKPVSAPVSFPETSDKINDYFDVIQNLNEVTRDGVKYYVLETQGSYDCNGEIITAAFKKWFNKDDFSLFRKETFKTNSNEANLIERTTYKVANQQVNYADVLNNFLFTTVNTIDISNKDSLETLQEFFTERLETIPGDSTIENLKISNFQDITLMDRVFYETEANYIKSINASPKPFLSYSLDKTNVDLYSTDVSDSSLFFSSEQAIPQDIKVENDFYSAKLYSNILPVSFSKATPSKQILVLEIDGLKYVFSSSNLDSIIKNGLSSLSLSDTFYANKI